MRQRELQRLAVMIVDEMERRAIISGTGNRRLIGGDEECPRAPYMDLTEVSLRTRGAEHRRRPEAGIANAKRATERPLRGSAARGPAPEA